MKFLFDLGGVFFDWHPTYFYKNIFRNNDDLDYFLNNICNDEWNIKQDAGRLIQDAEDDLISLHPKFKNEIRMYYKNHRKMLRGTFPKSIEILETLKNKQYKCYVLSNWSSETFHGMEEDYPFLKNFDGLIISGKEKMIKPNKEIYNLAKTRFKLTFSETVFIDDKFKNIETAKELGFNTIHLTDPDNIINEINKYI